MIQPEQVLWLTSLTDLIHVLKGNVYNDHCMHSTILRKKLIYFCWILLFVFILLLVGDFLYMKTSLVGLTDQVIIEIRGRNGQAEVVSIRNQLTENDPGKNLYLSLSSYEAFPDSFLANGQSVTIESNPDTELSRQYQFYPVRRKRSFVIEGLTENDETIQIVLGQPEEQGGLQ